MRRGSGQAAIIFILIIALIFLFTAITVNITKVSDTKTTLYNAADIAATNLAAKLGSYSKLLDEKGESAEGWDIGYIVSQIFAIAQIIFGAVTGQPEFVYFGIIQLGANVGSQILVGLDIADANRKLAAAGLDLQDQLREQAIQDALIRVIDDPKMVQDTSDWNENGDTTEYISRFTAWYQQRVNRILQEARDYTGSVLSCIEDFQTPLEAFRDKMVGTDEIPGFKDFLEEDFIDLLQDLKDEGFDVSFWVEGVDWDRRRWLVNTTPENDDIDRFIYMIDGDKGYQDNFDAFVTTTAENLENELLIIGEVFTSWHTRLYDEDEETGDWYSVFSDYSVKMDLWSAELRDIKDRLLEEGQGALVEEVTLAISTLKSAQDEPWLSDQPGIQQFRAAVDGLEIGLEGYTGTGEVIALRYNPVIYSWEDSRGGHHIKVYIQWFDMPTLDCDTTWWGKTTCDLLNGTGDCGVEITRFDEGRNTYLWDFVYTKPNEAEAGVIPGTRRTPGSRVVVDVASPGIGVTAICNYYCGGTY